MLRSIDDLSVKILIVLMIGASADKLVAQNYRFKENWYLGPQVNVVSFFGDLSVHDFNPARKLNAESDFAWGVVAGKSVNKFLDIRITANQGNMRGSNPDINMYFNNTFFESNLELVVSVTRLFKPKKKPEFEVRVLAGAGYISYRAIKYDLTDNSYISSVGYSVLRKPDGRRGHGFSVPVGLELDYYAGLNWALRTSFAFRIHSYDLLDAHIGSTGISDRYTIFSLGVVRIFNPAKSKKRDKISGAPDSF